MGGWPSDYEPPAPRDLNIFRRIRLQNRRSQEPTRTTTHPPPSAHRPQCAWPCQQLHGTPAWPCALPYSSRSRGPYRCWQWSALPCPLPLRLCLGSHAWWSCTLRSPVRSRTSWKSHVRRACTRCWCSGTATARSRPLRTWGSFVWCPAHGSSRHPGSPRSVGSCAACCEPLVSVRSCRWECLSSASLIWRLSPQCFGRNLQLPAPILREYKIKILLLFNLFLFSYKL